MENKKDQQERQQDNQVYKDALLLSRWFPLGTGRKIIVFILLIVGTYSLVHWALFLTLLFFVIATLFSPRIQGWWAIRESIRMKIKK